MQTSLTVVKSLDTDCPRNGKDDADKCSHSTEPKTQLDQRGRGCCRLGHQSGKDWTHTIVCTWKPMRAAFKNLKRNKNSGRPLTYTSFQSFRCYRQLSCPQTPVFIIALNVQLSRSHVLEDTPWRVLTQRDSWLKLQTHFSYSMKTLERGPEQTGLGQRGTNLWEFLSLWLITLCLYRRKRT